MYVVEGFVSRGNSSVHVTFGSFSERSNAEACVIALSSRFDVLSAIIETAPKILDDRLACVKEDETSEPFPSIRAWAPSFSLRARKVCLRMNVRSLDELCQLSKDEILACHNVGHVTLNELTDFLSSVGRCLKP